MFTCVNPAAVRRSALLPLWLPWNCTDSLDFLKRTTPHLDRKRPVLFTLLSNFSITPDLVSWAEWLEALADFDTHILGQRRWLFPSDPTGLWRTGDELCAWCNIYPRPVEATATLDDVLHEAHTLNGNV